LTQRGGRGRNRPHGRPPAQIPARGTTALGSYLGSSVRSVLGVTLGAAWALEPSAARRRSTNWVQEAVLPPPLSRLPTRRHGATHLTSLARLSVRGVFRRPCPLGLPPFLHRLRFRSGMRGSPHAALFDGFAGTTRQYDFPRRASRTCGLSLLRAARPSISRTGDRGISRFSRMEIPCMLRFFDRAGSADGSRLAPLRCRLPPPLTTSAPRSLDFAAQYPGLHVPLSTLRLRPRGRQRMTRGHRGSIG